ncbi:hypothetical protein B0T25DRAFT_569421 [Lasiosphaeria hispida]|uniref:Uncharacterized protein n=1 Tax=Lasiosphaeria hispida TaxID=260671 RepID=A0AAJ0HDA2_9PEZI|nr:hypothetical protein B0T25DRAFT_569421 [Lasiosphaeria hispida]
MDPLNPLAGREKALENQYIREKEKQMAKDRAAKMQATKDTSKRGEVQGQSGQEQK